MTRQTKTPKQRAEEALAVAKRKVVRLERDTDRLNLELVQARRALDEAIRLRDYAQQHPALNPPTPTTKENQA